MNANKLLTFSIWNSLEKTICSAPLFTGIFKTCLKTTCKVGLNFLSDLAEMGVFAPPLVIPLPHNSMKMEKGRYSTDEDHHQHITARRMAKNRPWPVDW